MDGNVFGLGRPIVTVVQPAQSIIGKHPTRGYAASSAPRRSLAQSKVRAVLVMVGDVLGKQPLQVPLVESNHMVEQLAAAAPHPPLGDCSPQKVCSISRGDLLQPIFVVQSAEHLLSSYPTIRR